jgi:hypothetical protein
MYAQPRGLTNKSYARTAEFLAPGFARLFGTHDFERSGILGN